MSIYYKFIGWCQEDNSDKVWVAIDLSNGNVNWAHDRNYVTVWGRRGKRLQHKVISCSGHDMDNLIRSKTNKGYQQVLKTDLDKVYPEFEAELEKTAAWAMLMA